MARLGLNATAMALPPCLATYMAMSARRSSSSPDGVSSPARTHAVPRLARTVTLRPATTTGSDSAVSRRSASASTSTSSSHRTANSSPPSRATVSAARVASPRRSPTATSNASPAWWPKESLTALKSSRSISTTATPRSWRRCRSSACATRSRNRARLARPVSASWNARKRSCACCATMSIAIRRLSVTTSSCRRNSAHIAAPCTISVAAVTRPSTNIAIWAADADQHDDVGQQQKTGRAEVNLFGIGGALLDVDHALSARERRRADEQERGDPRHVRVGDDVVVVGGDEIGEAAVGDTEGDEAQDEHRQARLTLRVGQNGSPRPWP